MAAITALQSPLPADLFKATVTSLVPQLPLI